MRNSFGLGLLCALAWTWLGTPIAADARAPDAGTVAPAQAAAPHEDSRNGAPANTQIPAATAATSGSSEPPESTPSANAETAHARNLASVVVRGVQPGPKLWKVTRGDHVLWILGTLSPLPRELVWDSRRAEWLIGDSGEVIVDPIVKLRSRAGLFATLAALPALVGLRNNPDGKVLAQVVPADLYQRWVPLKRKFIGGGSRVEKWRPMFAALELYAAAIKRSGLTLKPVVEDAVEKAARRAHVRITVPAVEVTVDKPRAAVKEFKAASIDDLACFRKTLDRIDTDLGAMRLRANAWATGDLQALRRLPFQNQMIACQDAVTRQQWRYAHGIDDIGLAARKAWMDAANRALEHNRTSFAMLPITRLLEPDGYLARFRAQGDVVEEPMSNAPPTAGATDGTSGANPAGSR